MVRCGNVYGTTGQVHFNDCGELLLDFFFTVLYTLHMNRLRREKTAQVFFDLSKYLLTAIAVTGAFVKDEANWLSVAVALLASVVSLLVANIITPGDK